jgi:hypothetical protein
MKKLEVGQIVYRVEWRDGCACLRQGRVTKTGRGGRWIDGKRSPRDWTWFASTKEAFHANYEKAFTWGLNLRSRNWEMDDSIHMIVSLRRIQKKLRKVSKWKHG